MPDTLTAPAVAAGSALRAAAWGLTGREFQVLELVSLGSTTAEISRELWISEHTVKTYVARMLGRHRVPNRAGLVGAAFAAGVLLPRRREPGAAPVRAGRGQVEVLPGVALGLTDRQIARRLVVAEDTVTSRVRRLMCACGVRHREHLVRVAVEHGLLVLRAEIAESAAGRPRRSETRGGSND